MNTEFLPKGELAAASREIGEMAREVARYELPPFGEGIKPEDSGICAAELIVASLVEIGAIGEGLDVEELLLAARIKTDKAATELIEEREAKRRQIVAEAAELQALRDQRTALRQRALRFAHDQAETDVDTIRYK